MIRSLRPALPARLSLRQSSTLARKPSPKRTKRRLTDLPARATTSDGRPLPALPAWPSQSSVERQGKDERIVSRGESAKTVLAKVSDGASNDKSKESVTRKPSKKTRRQSADPACAATDSDPLPPATLSAASTSDINAQDDEAYEAAIARGDVPRTPLAREVFLNMHRYQQDIILTRVGMFYEVSTSRIIL